MEELEQRLEALEAVIDSASCAGKHRYQQGQGELGDVIFCTLCGSITRLSQDKPEFGFKGCKNNDSAVPSADGPPPSQGQSAPPAAGQR